jgi:2,4-dienoyl-CoA reductase-like NADH-dependent reductase (Old Yellow Enzyme family)
MPADILFEPLEFRNLTIKNRILRSNISGRFDNYDGSGTQTRINWELKFARGGVGAIISSFVPVHVRGRIMPNYATIDRDERIPFWRELGRQVHELDCKYILQLSHGGRQRDVGGIEYPTGLSSTDKEEPLHGFPCERMTLAQIRESVNAFAEGADSVVHSRDSAKGRLRRRLDCSISSGQQRSGKALCSRARPAGQALYLLQQMPSECGRKPGGLLRRKPI